MKYALNSKGTYIAVIQFNRRTGGVKVLSIKSDLIIDGVARAGATISIDVNLINDLSD